jgi:hypothetical protein
VDKENKDSVKGMVRNDRPHLGEGKVSSIERVGSKNPENHSFRMPKDSEICDHSKVRNP